MRTRYWIAFGAILFASLAWWLITLRTSALLMLLVYVFASTGPASLRRLRVLVPVWLAFLAATWSPIDISLVSAPDGPKLVGCCPGSWSTYDSHKRAKELHAKGDCHICSDMINGFEAKQWVVW